MNRSAAVVGGEALGDVRSQADVVPLTIDGTAHHINEALRRARPHQSVCNALAVTKRVYSRRKSSRDVAVSRDRLRLKSVRILQSAGVPSRTSRMAWTVGLCATSFGGISLRLVGGVSLLACPAEALVVTEDEPSPAIESEGWRPQRDSNPCFGLERATSWASGRWGLWRRLA